MTLRLLVADDSVTIQKMVYLAFAGEDALIETVSDGDAAIDILREFKPDIVLADVSMPGYNGYEVCRLIRSDPVFSKIPVILLAGAFDPFDESEAARVRASGYLTKPFDTSGLIELIQKLQKDAISQAQPADGVENSAGNAPQRMIDPRVLESFMGTNRILEIIDRNPASEPEWSFPEEWIDRIAEKVRARLGSAEC